VITDRVREKALELAGGLPGYVYDLPSLRSHAVNVQTAIAATGAELFYAAKANPDPELLRTIGPHVCGFEVASGGELAHVRGVLPRARLAFGGPGKTDQELELALRSGVERIHVESPNELARLISVSAGRRVDILLRANLDLSVAGASLAMTGPFGMDEIGLECCVGLLRSAPWVHPRGVHAHLASGLRAPAMLKLGEQILSWALPWLLTNLPQVERPEINLGGGMAVDYAQPGTRFDWTGYARGLAALADPSAVQLRIEPGRAIAVYDGYYVTDVLDLKRTRGQAYVVLRGGTHHLRTPAAKGHSQPFTVIHRPVDGSALTSDCATLVGQLCTPKDVLARDVPVDELRVGDLVVFAMAGAYAWNISHHDFLMHPEPGFHYLGAQVDARDPAAGSALVG
jgi:diaminopimelate decarboxylase